MPNILLQQLENALPEGMQIPEELRKLYQWIEDNGYYEDRGGIRYGWLFPEEEIRESWTDEERIGGTIITFNVDEETYRNELLEIQYKQHLEEVKRRLLVFARSGADGSECALWLDGEGRTQIVHIGSGSGSMMTCILVKNGLDFLRLLAIGYDEICWDEDYPDPPNTDEDNTFVHPNTQYQEWVQNTFHTTIPKTGLEIVTPHGMDEDPTADPFLQWFFQMIDE
ncbi:MAG: SMI1/KNR4 family protein [Capnocytophaga sp.]|nr:SMI1/KNR4 family protein [Capnocytophaga sp.]